MSALTETDLRSLVRGDASLAHPTWSPDGSEILFESPQNGPDGYGAVVSEIHEVDADGSNSPPAYNVVSVLSQPIPYRPGRLTGTGSCSSASSTVKVSGR